MTLVPVDLPSPRDMRGRWAAFAAVLGALTGGPSRSAFAEPTRWHFDDAGGNWVDLHHLGDGRAVLIGNDHEYSDTYFRDAATYFQEEETDLLADAPGWWAPPAEAAMAAGEWVGFVYGFDGSWSRAAYTLDDGFRSIGLPAVDDERCRDLITAFAASDESVPVGRAEVDALIRADTHITEPMLRAVSGAPGWEPAVGVAVAAAFRRAAA